MSMDSPNKMTKYRLNQLSRSRKRKRKMIRRGLYQISKSRNARKTMGTRLYLLSLSLTQSRSKKRQIKNN